MSVTFNFLIRDGLASDIESCLALDHLYRTEHVWQMNVQQGVSQQQITFKIERLPRMMEVTYPMDEKRLRLALPHEQCFLVATGRDEPEVFGYLTMRNDETHSIALIQDVVISRPFRRQRIGSRLLKVAQQWAREHDLNRLMIEVRTKNHPAIQFCLATGFVFCGFNDLYFANQDIAVFFGASLR